VKLDVPIKPTILTVIMPRKVTLQSVIMVSVFVPIAMALVEKKW
jgi:hypothetical protein